MLPWERLNGQWFTELPWQEAYGAIIQDGVASVGIILALAALAAVAGVFIGPSIGNSTN